jgi:hypothetical protein
MFHLSGTENRCCITHAERVAVRQNVAERMSEEGWKFALHYYEVPHGEDTMQLSPNRYVDITRMESREKA